MFTHAAFRLFDTTYPAYRVFMLLTAIAMFAALLAVFWNASAPPWSANGAIFPPTFSANCLSTRLLANCATLLY